MTLANILRTRDRGRLYATLFCAIAFTAIQAHAQEGSTPRKDSQTRSSATAQTGAGPQLTVTGSGTVGQLTKWLGFGNGNSAIGDSVITETKQGSIGIGTTAPNSKLSVQGTIENTLGGFKFPDGSIQTTAAASGLLSILRDDTLTGNGTNGSPLGIAVPLNLSGSAMRLVVITNSATSGTGVFAKGGNSNDDRASGGAGLAGTGGDNNGGGDGGTGISGLGGNGDNNIGFGGDGATANGGSGARGGRGVAATGGFGAAFGGIGVQAFGGGTDFTGTGGVGVQATGGGNGINGGAGVTAFGGSSSGGGGHGGDGISAVGGTGNPGTTPGRAGFFQGDVDITGNLNVTGGTKNFKIDHPLDPENKYLFHAAVESSEVLDIYSGNAFTDQNGEAIVVLPPWFEALNKDHRYQLTVIGTFAQAIVAAKVRNNRFAIRTNAPGVEVSWQVTGVRSDAAMLRHPFNAEQEKPESERGYYLNPEAFDQAAEKNVEWSGHPQFMQKVKEMREQAKAKMESENDR